MATGWTNTGILKTAGIPAPTGKYRVGCVHLIHDDLFMRLYYPTDSNQTTTTNYQYAKHAYDSKYNRTVLEFQEYKLAGILGTLVPPLISTTNKLVIMITRNRCQDTGIVKCSNQ